MGKIVNYLSVFLVVLFILAIVIAFRANGRNRNGNIAFGAQAPSVIDVTAFGATGNGVTNDTAAINNAIAALTGGDTLFFPCGTYLVTSQLTINVSNIAVDGSNCAVIKNTGSGTVAVIGVGGNVSPNYGPAAALSATANELDTTFTTVSGLGVVPGDYIRLQEGGKDPGGDTACDPSSCRGELLKVASVSGNTITVTTALHDTYNPSLNAATAQKLLGPLTGVTVKNITFDGNGTNTYGFSLSGVSESTVSGVTSKNVQGAAILGEGGFNVSWSNITVTGAGSELCGSAVWLQNMANSSVNGMSVSSLIPGAPFTGCLGDGAFGFELIGSANNTITNLTVDASGASGRPFKTAAARWNTWNSVTVKNGSANMNGMAIEYYSSHNAFNSCIVTNNGAGGTGTGNAGINSWGNFNQYNTFNNCTVAGNGNVQFMVGNWDALGLGADSNVTINGGTFTGTNTNAPVIVIMDAGAYVTSAKINGQWGMGALYLGSINACVNSNTFVAGAGSSVGILSNDSTNMGSGNILNGLSSNLTPGTCIVP